MAWGKSVSTTSRVVERRGYKNSREFVPATKRNCCLRHAQNYAVKTIRLSSYIDLLSMNVNII